MSAPPSVRDRLFDVAYAMARRFWGGLGSIIALHRVVRNDERSVIGANRRLEITKQDLRAILEWVRNRGFEVVRMDEVKHRLAEPRGGRFLSFTFDDGYRDTLTEALPVFRDFGFPLTVYVTTGFLSRTTSPWWYGLEELMSKRDSLTIEWGGEAHTWQWLHAAERERVFGELSALIRQQDQQSLPILFDEISKAGGIDLRQAGQDLMMNWDELREWAGDWHLAVGAHTAGHFSLAQIGDDDLEGEMIEPRAVIESRLGKPALHLAYPFGGESVGQREIDMARDADYSTAVTSGEGCLSKRDAWRLLMLPRIPLGGDGDVIERFKRAVSGLK
jgi:peptidoglycan/xylan/chitin deacetylase (PgdA/CDA1 family)